MLKLNKFLILLTTVTLFACEEVMPPIDFTEGPEILLDTTYVVQSIPAAEPKNVLIEDLTGVRCVNCPDAAASAKAIRDGNPGRVIVVGLYTSQPTNLTFPHDGSEDLRTEGATNIYTNLYGSPPLPGGGVNRTIFAGQTEINQQHSLWASGAQSELAKNSVVNESLDIKALDDSTFALKTEFTFTQALDKNVFITILLYEDHIEAAQSTTSGEDHEYEHEHVLRAMYTPYNGSPLYDQPESGRTVLKDYVVVVPEHVNMDNASFVVYLNYNETDNKEVLQCKEIKL